MVQYVEGPPLLLLYRKFAVPVMQRVFKPILTSLAIPVAQVYQHHRIHRQPQTTST